MNRFLQTGVQTKFCPRSADTPPPPGVDQPSRQVLRSLGPMPCLCLEHHSLGHHRAATSVSRSLLCSLVFVVFVFLAVRQGRARPDLPVAVQPLLDHVRDQGVAAPPRAFLHGDQHATLGHAAVQPLTQQPLLLLLVAQLQGEGGREARRGQIPLVPNLKAKATPCLHRGSASHQFYKPGLLRPNRKDIHREARRNREGPDVLAKAV